MLLLIASLQVHCAGKVPGDLEGKLLRELPTIWSSASVQTHPSHKAHVEAQDIF